MMEPGCKPTDAPTLTGTFGIALSFFVLTACAEGIDFSDDDAGETDGECMATSGDAWSEQEDDWTNAGDLRDIQVPGGLIRKPGYEAPSCTINDNCAGFGNWCVGNICQDLQAHHDLLTAIHVIHMQTGEFLMFHGEHDERVWTIGEPGEDMRWFPVPYHVERADRDGPLPDGYPDIFCSGHVLLPEGHALIAGGNITGDPMDGGLESIFSFDPTGANPQTLPYGWTEREEVMAWDRWYPTLTVLADGKVLISGGISREDYEPEVEIQAQNTFELYDPVDDVIATLDLEFTWGDMPLYPFIFQLPNGDVLYAGGEDAGEDARDGRILIPGATAQDWEWADVSISSETNGGSAVMYAPGKIMKSGGIESNRLANAITEVLDLSEYASDDYPAEMAWDVTDPMHKERHFHTLTLLPDGRVLATGGNSYSNSQWWEDYTNLCKIGQQDIKDIAYSSNCPHHYSECYTDGMQQVCTNGGTSCTTDAECGAPCVSTCPDDAQCTNGHCVKDGYGWAPYRIAATDTCNPNNNECFATKTAEIWDPNCQEWTEFLEQERPRMYHSTAALLPDGRVISAGGGHRPFNSDALEEQPYAEYFEPVYGGGTRPQYSFDINNDPAYLAYNQAIPIFHTNDTLAPVKATLIKLAAVTHGFDQGQMIVPLGIEHVAGDLYRVDGPRDTADHTAAATAPPGYYMLFLQTSLGQISTGQYIRVGDQDAANWSCVATTQLAANETVCDTTPNNGDCPSGYESQEEVPLPVLDPTQGSNGWEVVTPPGLVEDPLAPTASEIQEILGLCAIACQQQWASVPEISANCASAGVFETPELLEEGVAVTRDLIAPDLQDGSGIFSGESLSCSLSESCCMEFDELLCDATNHRPTVADAPQGGPAEYEVSLASGSIATLDAGLPAEIDLSGEAGYGHCPSQGSGTCPFYLDRLEMVGESGTTEMRMTCDDSTTQAVEVSDLEIRLIQPAFGIATATGDVGFPIGGLFFETSLTVDSVPYSHRYPVTAPVTGVVQEDDFTMSDLEFELTVPCNTSKSTVTVALDLTGGTALAEPPWISITLPISPACSTAMDLSAVYGDPDSDIVSVRWRMDGVLLSSTLTQVVPTGSHTLTAIATDARGATTTTSQTFQCN